MADRICCHCAYLVEPERLKSFRELLSFKMAFPICANHADSPGRARGGGRLRGGRRGGRLRVAIRRRRTRLRMTAMTETHSDLKIEGVPPALGEPLKLLTAHLEASLADNLSGITVVGSALTDDFRPGASDINTVVLLRRHTTAALGAIASMAKPLRKQNLSPPLLMTQAYIDRSRDVFGVEFLDFQLTHRTVLGDDPFASLAFEKADVRQQCERELKATLIRLRQGFIASAGNHKLIRDVLIAAGKGLAPLLRAMLWLQDVERSGTMEPTFRRAAEEFSVNLDAAVKAERWRYEKPRLTDAEIESAFESIYAATDRLAEIVDGLEVA